MAYLSKFTAVRMHAGRLWKSMWCRWLAALIAVLVLVIFFRDERQFPTYAKIDPFQAPAMPAFKCIAEQSVMPTLDVQADAWLREAHRLDALHFSTERRDESRQLLKQAGDRDYWPAMHALAWNYVVDPTWRHNRGSALKVLRRGMHLGYPDAYYRMGLYVLEGWGVPVDRDLAYAYWQKAAYMGSPTAMTEVAKVLSTKQNNTIGNDLVNLPVATQMLECAMAQGYGDAGETLADIIRIPKADNGTVLGHVNADTDARSQRVLQNGVKLGCGKCAGSLGARFSGELPGDDISSNQMRADFYWAASHLLEDNDKMRLPDLDNVMPLPPSTLPRIAADYKVALELARGNVPAN